MIQPSTKGFFFIESSLAIIASIGILSAALFPSMTAYMKRSRDAARISNIYEISTALSTYYADTESYPPPEKGCLPVDVLKKYFLRNVPNDPNT